MLGLSLLGGAENKIKHGSDPLGQTLDEIRKPQLIDLSYLNRISRTGSDPEGQTPAFS